MQIITNSLNKSNHDMTQQISKIKEAIIIVRLQAINQFSSLFFLWWNTNSRDEISSVPSYCFSSSLFPYPIPFSISLKALFYVRARRNCTKLPYYGHHRIHFTGQKKLFHLLLQCNPNALTLISRCGQGGQIRRFQLAVREFIIVELTCSSVSAITKQIVSQCTLMLRNLLKRRSFSHCIEKSPS